MENKTYKVIVNLILGMVGFGLGMIAVSMFLNFMHIGFIYPMLKIEGMMGGIDLFGSAWNMYKTSPAFVIISYVVLIVGLVIMAVDASIRQKLKKKVKGLNYVGLVLVIVGFVLLIVSIAITKGKVEDEHSKLVLNMLKETGQTNGMTDEMVMLSIGMVFSYDLGVGSIMAIIGGVIALIASVLLVLPAFDPIKLAAASEATTSAPTATVQPAPAAQSTEQPAPEAEANSNNDTIV
ncbi:MAG: hypothetical protein K2O04_06175 [Clostridiales bacterium]|nr:hypothetical protein [Clostridiales bacterium]